MQGSRIEAHHDLNFGRAIRLVAEDVRKERTGIHAKIMVYLDDELLAWTNFNVERDEDRVRLANSAFKSLGPLEREGYSAEELKSQLGLFCAGLWEAQIGEIEIGPMSGRYREGGPTFCLYPFVISGGGTMIFAPPGRGKSFTAMLMAVSMDAGYDGLFAATQQRVLYVNIERSADSMGDRLARVNDCLGLERERSLHFLNARGKSLHDVVDAVRRYVDKNNIEVVVLDSVSRAGFGDLNDNQSANKIVDNLNALSRTWLAIAHTPRSDDSHVFGSVHFDAGFDIGVKLTTQAAPGVIGVGLTVAKGNDVPMGGKPLMYALEFDQTGLVAVRGVRPGEFVEIEGGGEAQSPLARLQSVLLSVGEATGTMLAEMTGMDNGNISRTLSSATWARKRREGREVWYSVIYNGDGTR